MTVPRRQTGPGAILFVLVTPVLTLMSISLEQIDPRVPGKFAFVVLLGPTLLVPLIGKRWQGLTTALVCGVGCVVAGWAGMGMKLAALCSPAMTMPVLFGAALLSVGTLVTLRCDEAERRIRNLDLAVARVVAAENLESLARAVLDAADSLVPRQALELYVWEPHEQAFVPAGSRNTVHSKRAVPLFGGVMTDGSALAPTVQDWQCLDRELDRLHGAESRMPLISGEDEVFGFLRFESENQSSASNASRLLQILASFSGLAVKNVLLIERLREQARRDGLTGLMNYAAFQDELSRAVAETAESASSLALILMDLDEFKQVNDRYGHHFGSLMLQRLAEIWRHLLPPGAMLARYGGDEFACILPHSCVGEVLAHLRVLKRELAENPVVAGDVRLQIEPSIGVALYPTDAGSTEELFHQADKALYTAKRKGGGFVCMAGDDEVAEVEASRSTPNGGQSAELSIWKADSAGVACTGSHHSDREPAFILPISAS